jgi:hypothetical protein
MLRAMSCLFVVLAFGPTACAPVLMANGDGGVVHRVDAYHQVEAGELADRYCAMSGNSSLIRTLDSVYGDLSFDCRSP